MSDILDELYAGDLCPISDMPDDPEYKETLHQLALLRKELEDSLNAQSQTLFEAYCDLRGKMDCLHEMITFEEGFRIGAKLIIAVEHEKKH